MLLKPGMADPVKTGFDIALQNPFGRSLTAQNRKTLPYGVGGGTFRSKPVGIRICQRFRCRFERQQMKRLLGTIEHAGNGKGPKLSVLLGDVDSP
jgi:hypothetical protein